MCPASKHGEVSMEEEEKIMKRYEKGLSKAALRFLEEEETLTKEFTERVGEEAEEEERGREDVIVPKVGRKKKTTMPSSFLEDKQIGTMKSVSVDGGEEKGVSGFRVETPSLNDDRNREEKEKEKKKTEKKKKKKTPLVSLPPSSSKGEEKEKKKKKKEEEEQAGSLSRLGSAFDMIQSQIIDPADMLLTRKMVINKNVDDDDIRGSSRELLQSSRGREVLSADGSVRGTPAKSFIETGASPMEKQQHQTHQTTNTVQLDKGTNTINAYSLLQPVGGKKKVKMRKKGEEAEEPSDAMAAKEQATTTTTTTTTTTATKNVTRAPPTKSIYFKKKRQVNVRKQLSKLPKASMIENDMRSKSTPPILEDRHKGQHTVPDFDDFLHSALGGTEDVNIAAIDGNDNIFGNNDMYYPRCESLPNMSSFWKQCKLEAEQEEEEEKDGGKSTAQQPHRQQARQKQCDCKECVAALMEHAMKVGRYVVAQEEEKRLSKENHQEQTAEEVVTMTTTAVAATTTTPLEPIFSRPPPLHLVSAGITGGTFDVAINPLLSPMIVSPSVMAETGVKKHLDTTTTTTNKKYTDSAASPTLSDPFIMSPLLDQLHVPPGDHQARRKGRFDMVSTDDEDGREVRDA